MGTPSANITACVVLHDDISALGSLCASLERQSQVICQFVFCLNGTDPTVRDAVIQEMPQATILERPDNPGFSGGINACMEEATGDYVFTLNADVDLDEAYVANCLAAFDSEENVGVVGGLLMRPDGLVDSAGFAMQPWMRVVDRGSGAQDHSRFSRREVVVGVCGAAALFSKVALLDIAENSRVMDEDFWMYKEDQDICLRLNAGGFVCVFEPKAQAVHQRGWAAENRREVPIQLRRHSLKNRYLLLLKHWRFPNHVRMLPLLLLFEVFLFFGLCLRDPRAMTGYAMAVRLLPKMLRKRKELKMRARNRRLGIKDESSKPFVAA